MTPTQALKYTEELNKTGRHRADWFYYPAHADSKSGGGLIPAGWFVMRRRKQAEIHVAIYADGKTSIREKQLTPGN